MGVNPFLSALGDIFQGISVDSERKRKLKKQEEDDLSRDDQQMFQNQIALQQLGARPTSDMTSVLAALQPMKERQMAIGTALTPQQLLKAAAVPVSAELSNRPGYEDVSKEQALPSDISSMIADVSSNLRSPPLTLRGRNGATTNFTVDPTQTQPALAAAAALKAEQAREARQEIANDAILKRTTEAAEKTAQAALVLKARAGKGKWAAFTAGLQDGDPLKTVDYDALEAKVGDVSEYVDTKIKLEQSKANDIARQNRIDVQKDVTVRAMQDRYEKSNKRFDSYAILVPEMLSVATAKPSAAERGTADNLILTTVARLMDPTTGVREAEFRNAANSGGLWDRVRMISDSIASGQKMTDEYRKDIVRLTLRIAQVVRDASAANDARYQQMIAQQGLNKDQLILNTPFPHLDLEEIGVWAGLPEAVQAKKDRAFIKSVTPRKP